MIDNDNYCIYMHINKVNCKVYIGQTCQEPEKRWGKDGIKYLHKKNGKYHHPHFANAIQKYGWDNFEHIILADGLTQNQANVMEEFLIKCLDSTNPKKGYNIRFGGDNHKLSEETKKKIGAKHKGNKYNLGKHHSEETKKKIAESHKGEKNYNYGKHLTEEHKQHISESNKGKKNTWQSKAVIQLTKNDEIVNIFESALEAERQTGIFNTCIIAVCKGKRKSAGGYHWKYYNKEVS